MKILIVDDNDLTRSLVRDLVSAMGHEVLGEAETGDQALKLYPVLKPELVMMDMIMPGKTGLETLLEMKAMDPAAKVVMVTAVQQDHVVQQLMEKGAIAVLSKPFLYADLDEVLKKIP